MSRVANIQTRRSINHDISTAIRGRGRPREFDREQGLRKAMQIFWSLGYEATSMADLRAALGINQASLYAAYGSKEELFREVVTLYRKTDGVATARALVSDLSTHDAIHAMLQDGVHLFTAHAASRGCLLVLSTINCTVENKGVQEYLSSLRKRTCVDIEARLRRGQREGDVAKNVPVKAIAAFYATVLHGLSIQARDGASRKILTEVVNTSMRAWNHLVGATANPSGGQARRATSSRISEQG